MENKKIAQIIAIGCGIGTIAAFTILSARKKLSPPTKDEDKTELESVEAKPAVVPSEKKEQRSRAENMFGPRETWGNNQPSAPRPDGYKGFLYIECES